MDQGERLLQAQMKGKLTRQEEAMEDLLTSNVFGSIKYLEPKEGLVPILKSSIDINDRALTFPFDQISQVHYEFWPWIKESGCNGCEPDVFITIELSENRKIILLVEAKYLSDKSSEADTGLAPQDQLAREYDNLERKAKREHATPFFIYVTADIGYPKDSIVASASEYAEKRKGQMQVFWISWRKITRLFPYAKSGSILSDLTRILEKQGLVFFEGITKIRPKHVSWSFKAKVNWDWTFTESLIDWVYQTQETIKWQEYQIGAMEWRFTK